MLGHHATGPAEVKKTQDLDPCGQRGGPGHGQTLQKLSGEKSGTFLKWLSSL